jgi:hypothetical protein
MRPLRKYLVGEKITADMINGIVDSIRESQINSVVGGAFKRSAGGTTISINAPPPQKGTGSVSQPICPFDPQATATSSGYSVSFSAGTVNGFLPSNMFSPLTGVTTSARNYFYIKCTSDGKSLSTAIIEKDTSIRTPPASTIDSAPTIFNILIATMATSGAIVKTIPCQNLSASIVPTIQEDNSSFVVGERNFKQYYNWEI